MPIFAGLSCPHSSCCHRYFPWRTPLRPIGSPHRQRKRSRRWSLRNPETGRIEVRRCWHALFGPDSMVPSIQDLRDFVAHQKWFFGKGPRPQFDRWTYWERFDYFAVFWGIFMIGVSGLILWFPKFFTLFLPGWMINIAHVIHSDEALLAAGFIFTFHFLLVLIVYAMLSRLGH